LIIVFHLFEYVFIKKKLKTRVIKNVLWTSTSIIQFQRMLGYVENIDIHNIFFFLFICIIFIMVSTKCIIYIKI